MGRTIALFTVLFFGVLAAAPESALGQRGQGRGPGFGGGRGPGFGQGRGPGFGQGRGMRNHAAANDKADKPQEVTYPVIANHGGVVQLPDAAQQPRKGTKLLVDLTGGGDADKLNTGLEKVAKYLNIYAGGGAEPADVQIAVVFHGDATLAVLHPGCLRRQVQDRRQSKLETPATAARVGRRALRLRPIIDLQRLGSRGCRGVHRNRCVGTDCCCESSSRRLRVRTNRPGSTGSHA